VARNTSQLDENLGSSMAHGSNETEKAAHPSLFLVRENFP